MGLMDSIASGGHSGNIEGDDEEADEMDDSASTGYLDRQYNDEDNDGVGDPVDDTQTGDYNDGSREEPNDDEGYGEPRNDDGGGSNGDSGMDNSARTGYLDRRYNDDDNDGVGDPQDNVDNSRPRIRRARRTESGNDGGLLDSAAQVVGGAVDALTGRDREAPRENIRSAGIGAGVVDTISDAVIDATGENYLGRGEYEDGSPNTGGESGYLGVSENERQDSAIIDYVNSLRERTREEVSPTYGMALDRSRPESLKNVDAPKPGGKSDSELRQQIANQAEGVSPGEIQIHRTGSGGYKWDYTPQDIQRARKAGSSIYEKAEKGGFLGAPLETTFVGGEMIARAGHDAGKAVRDVLPLENVGPRVPGVDVGGVEVGGQQTVGGAAEGIVSMIPSGIGLAAGQVAQAPMAVGGAAREAVSDDGDSPVDIAEEVASRIGRGTVKTGEFAAKHPVETAGMLALPYAGKAVRSFGKTGRIGSRLRTLSRSDTSGQVVRRAVERGDINYPSWSEKVRVAKEKFTTRQSPSEYPVKASSDPVVEMKRLAEEFTPEKMRKLDEGGYLMKHTVEGKKSSKPGSASFETRAGRKYDTEGAFVGGEAYPDIKGAVSAAKTGKGTLTKLKEIRKGRAGTRARINHLLDKGVGKTAKEKALSEVKNFDSQYKSILKELKNDGIAKATKRRVERALPDTKEPHLIQMEVSDIRRMPESVKTEAAAEKFLETQGRSDVAYVRSPSRTTAEAEAIIPKNSEYVKVDGGYKVNIRGRKVPADTYAPIEKVIRAGDRGVKTLKERGVSESVAREATRKGEVTERLRRELESSNEVKSYEEVQNIAREGRQAVERIAERGRRSERVSTWDTAKFSSVSFLDESQTRTRREAGDGGRFETDMVGEETWDGYEEEYTRSRDRDRGGFNEGFDFDLGVRDDRDTSSDESGFETERTPTQDRDYDYGGSTTWDWDKYIGDPNNDGESDTPVGVRRNVDEPTDFTEAVRDPTDDRNPRDVPNDRDRPTRDIPDRGIPPGKTPPHDPGGGGGGGGGTPGLPNLDLGEDSYDGFFDEWADMWENPIESPEDFLDQDGGEL
ncbi:MAG: hypothetical protein SV253_08160 [Halobacteria archaeon]|nr:hypothetical protein [Halobacteria archaeon]